MDTEQVISQFTKQKYDELRAEVARLRGALLPLLDEIGSGSDMDYHMRTDGHAERLQAALSPADEPQAAQHWLAQHDAEVRRECAGIAESFCHCPEAYAGRSLIDPTCDCHDIAEAIYEQEAAE